MTIPFSKQFVSSFSVLAAMAVAGSAHAVVVTQWDFNSVPPDASTSTGTTAPATGSGSASLVGGTSASVASGSGSSDPATSDDTGWSTTSYAAQGSENKSRGVEFKVSTVGFSGVIISYDLRHSNTSSAYEQFQYSLDGTNFIDFALFEGNAGDTWFNNRLVDLSSVSGADNNADFAFRIVAAFKDDGYVASNPASGYGTSGTWRFDMVTVQAAPVPEADSYALLLAGLGLVGWRARRRLGR